MMRRLCFVLSLPWLVISTIAILPERAAPQVAHRSTPETAECQEPHDREALSALENQRMHARSPEHKNSIQILYKENVFSYVHEWGVYFGPRGIAVDPCNLGPFKEDHYEVTARPGSPISDIDTPPPTPKGRWSELSSLPTGADCSIVGDGLGPPTLKCGQDRTMAFAKDPGYCGAATGCLDGPIKYHRAYYVEFTL
ncbi:hypothetical protein J4E82_010439 [Alternaria postmessia]|uniref:uncharacterized protein n=1 Tax=Alternaria postmessia TaxID=1187938 RepID=UPI002224128F|nr:uncharacterized protein J4E82_010439 [Alternaria postmessia]KAH8621764.1 hypothetical protein IG631_23641 [Alternaria alternata]KAI5368766.1 hypothetical protein J4E82_010439 [Alternaria postmessia]